MRTKLSAIFAASVIVLTFFFSPKVFAQDTAVSPNPTEKPDTTTTGLRSPRPSPFTGLTGNRETTGTDSTRSGLPRLRLGLDRLKDKRLTFCENHKDEITKRLTNLGKLVSDMLGKFDAIATRVEQFYTTKVVPTNKTVPNYDGLVADIETKKKAVNDALASATTDVQGFSCTADNPKGQLGLFRTDMQTIKKDLQDYRTSIKNLIVAVRSVVGETQKESPKPTESTGSGTLNH